MTWAWQWWWFPIIKLLVNPSDSRKLTEILYWTIDKQHRKIWLKASTKHVNTFFRLWCQIIVLIKYYYVARFNTSWNNSWSMALFVNHTVNAHMSFDVALVLHLKSTNITLKHIHFRWAFMGFHVSFQMPLKLGLIDTMRTLKPHNFLVNQHMFFIIQLKIRHKLAFIASKNLFRIRVWVDFHMSF